MSDSQPPTEVYYDIVLPEELQPGEYANFLTVWHTGHEFTLDFSATQPAQPVPRDDGGTALRVPCRVVVRVKIPPTLVFDIIRALNTNMTAFEQRYGAIRRPGEDEPLFPPDNMLGGTGTGSGDVDDNEEGDEPPPSPEEQ